LRGNAEKGGKERANALGKKGAGGERKNNTPPQPVRKKSGTAEVCPLRREKTSSGGEPAQPKSHA